MTSGGDQARAHATPSPVRAPSPDAKAVFSILVRDHADMLAAYLRTLTIPSGPSAVDDLFQETMLVAWRRLGEYDAARPFAAWLRGIAQVLVLEHARKGRRRPVTVDPAVLVEIDRRFDVLARSPGDSFFGRAERLLDCLKTLPAAMREAVELVHCRGIAVAAAAASVGASEEALKKRIQRGRQLVADCLGVGKDLA